MSLKKPKDILEEIQIIFDDIKDNTGWEPSKLPNDIKIEIGDAPEYFESFGVNRKKDKLIFGIWIDEVEPKAISNHFWEFLIIRESFAFYINNELLFGPQAILVNFLLNILALSYLQINDPESARDIKFIPIQGRFLIQKQEKNQLENEIIKKIYSLIEVVNQGTSYIMMKNTFDSFIEDLDIEEIDSEDVLDDLRRYLSNEPEEIAAPIFLKKNTTNVLLKLIEYGFNTSASKLAKELDVNQSTITRQITKLSSKFYAKWRLERNYSKLGLYSYILVIRFPNNYFTELEGIYDDLLEISYIDMLFDGSNNQNLFLYSVIHCPHLVSEKIAKRLLKYQENNLISSFELKLIKNRVFRTAIVEKPFKPLLSNFKKLINNEIQSKRIVLWDSYFHANTERETIDQKDENIIQFLSIIISKSLSQFGLFGTHMNELTKFFIENRYDINKTPECLTFINKLQNRAYELGLIEYRFNISLTGIASSVMTIFSINKKSRNKDLSKLIDKISIFGWICTIETLECYFFLVLGPSHNDKISNLIAKTIKNNNFEYESFNMKQKMFRYIDYSSHFDYSSQKWKL